jgi:hypothetical protein
MAAAAVDAPADVSAKRRKTIIGTHNGTFHCDEALGCYLVRACDRSACAGACLRGLTEVARPQEGRQVAPRRTAQTMARHCLPNLLLPNPPLLDAQLRQTPAFKNAEIVRSRDPAVLATADVVIDVGGVYEPENQVCVNMGMFE